MYPLTNARGVFYFFSHSSAIVAVVEGGRRRKGLRQEYPEPGRAVGGFWKTSAVVRAAAPGEGDNRCTRTPQTTRNHKPPSSRCWLFAGRPLARPVCRCATYVAQAS